MSRLQYLGLKWQAMAWLVFGGRDRAQELFDQMLAEFPGDSYAMASKANLLAQQGDRAGALRLFESLVELQPGIGAHWFNLGFKTDQLIQYEIH